MATVIVQQGGGGGGMQQNVTDWSSGIFGCFEDCGGCLCGFFFLPIYMCVLSTRMRETCCVGCCLGSAGLMAMRTKVRTAYGIRGSICGDFCCASQCPQLTACQTDRELSARGVDIF